MGMRRPLVTEMVISWFLIGFSYRMLVKMFLSLFVVLSLIWAE